MSNLVGSTNFPPTFLNEINDRFLPESKILVCENQLREKKRLNI